MKIHMVLAKRIAKNLPLEREKQKISQAHLADLTGVSRPYINKIESGEKENLSLETVERLAKGLGIDAVRLMKE